MKNMKKLICITALLLAALAFTACGNNNDDPPEDVTLRVAALRGPTALGMLQLMQQHYAGHAANDYDFTLLNAPDEAVALMVRGDVDIAAVPGNLAAVLYGALDGDVQALAVVTLGVLHIVDTTGEIHAIEDLRGRTIFVSPPGATPEFSLNYVLTQNGLTPGVDVNSAFRSELAEIAALLNAGEAEIALLPEPFVSNALATVDGLRVALDLTEEWNRVQPDYGLIMSVVIARRDFVANYPAAVAAFMAEYAESIRYMTTQHAHAAQLAVDFGIIPNVNIAASALPRTHMVFMYGEEMRRNLTGFYQVLYNENPVIIGGGLPSDAFYFIP